MGHISNKISSVARTAAVGTLSMVLAAVGVAFLTVAAWLLLTATQTPLFAATVIGAVYLGLSLVGLAFAASGGRHDSRPAVARPQDLSPLQLVAVSFIDGLEQGSRARRKP